MEKNEHLADVIPFPKRNVEEINGQHVDLGRLSLSELELLEKQCSVRLEDARFEWVVVEEELGQRRGNPGPGGRAS